MNFKKKKLLLLDELYTRRFDGKNYSAQTILGKYNSNWEEAKLVAKALESEGLISLISTKDGTLVKIEFPGIEFIEENKVELPIKEYQPIDIFSSDERKEIFQRLDQMNQRLSELQLGQEITYNDLYEEISELKALTRVLGKRDWIQILKGKLVDLGLGFISDKVLKIVIESFKDYPLLDK